MGRYAGYGSDTIDGIYFGWGIYKWCNNSGYSLTKYNVNSSYGPVDNKTVLDREDDAASVALGGGWRMPTDEECTELRENWTWTVTTLNGVNGFKVQSTKSGYTDKWIFLPFTGYRDVDIVNYYGVNSFIWSSSLRTDKPLAAFLAEILDGGNRGWFVTRYGYNRYYGCAIRPVLE